MTRTVRHHLAAALAAASLTAGLLAAAPAAHAVGIDLSDPAAVTVEPDWSCGSVGDSDRDIATRLNLQLTGTLYQHLTPYRVSCARAIVNAVQAQNLPQRAAVIAVTTSIVETTLRNNPNTEDHDSVGLFQQRASWGSFAQRMDPTWSTNAFLKAMVRVSNWQTRPIGEVCQAVQISAFPGRYQPQAADAERIVNALLSSGSSGGDQPVAGNWDGGP
ncbi:peptidase M23, partial [Kitasatospora misakiensis]